MEGVFSHMIVGDPDCHEQEGLNTRQKYVHVYRGGMGDPDCRVHRSR